MFRHHTLTGNPKQPPKNINELPRIGIVPDFGGWFWPIFRQAEEYFFLLPLDHCLMKVV